MVRTNCMRDVINIRKFTHYSISDDLLSPSLVLGTLLGTRVTTVSRIGEVLPWFPSWDLNSKMGVG